MESTETARRAETWGGRLRMVAPGVFWTLIAAPVAAALTYRSGKRLSIGEARRVALAVGLLIAFCSFSGAGLFVMGKQAYLFPLWGFIHLGGHRLASAVASACPFGWCARHWDAGVGR